MPPCPSLKVIPPAKITESSRETIVASDQECVAKLRAAIHAHARIIADNPAGAAVFLREDRGLGEDYRQWYLAKRDHVEGLYRGIVRQGIEEGYFRDTDVNIYSGTIDQFVAELREEVGVRP